MPCARASPIAAPTPRPTCCSCLANADVEEDYSDARDASSGSPLGASPCVVRLLLSLYAMRSALVTSAFLPGVAQAPAEPGLALRARAAIPALAARVARQCSSHICLRRRTAGGGRLVVARATSTSSATRWRTTNPSLLATSRRRRSRSSWAALDELRAVKRLFFVEPRLAENARGAVLRVVLSWRPSCARPLLCGNLARGSRAFPDTMTHCLMSTQVPRVAPLPRGVRPRAPSTRSTSRKTSRRRRRRAAYVAALCGGDDFGAADSPRRGARARSAHLALAPRRRLDAPASATGVSAARTVYGSCAAFFLPQASRSCGLIAQSTRRPPEEGRLELVSERARLAAAQIRPRTGARTRSTRPFTAASFPAYRASMGIHTVLVEPGFVAYTTPSCTGAPSQALSRSQNAPGMSLADNLAHDERARHDADCHATATSIATVFTPSHAQRRAGVGEK